MIFVHFHMNVKTVITRLGKLLKTMVLNDPTMQIITMAPLSNEHD